MIGGGRPQLDGQLNCADMAGMEPGLSPCFTPAGMIESAPGASGQRGADGEHLLGHRPQVCLAEVFKLGYGVARGRSGPRRWGRSPISLATSEKVDLGEGSSPYPDLTSTVVAGGEHPPRPGDGILHQRVGPGLAGGGDR